MEINSICVFHCMIKRCAGVRNLKSVNDFCCPASIRRGEIEVPEDDSLEIDEVKEFCYLGDVLDSDGGVERSVRGRIATTWKKWREISSMLRNKGIPLKHRGKNCEACVRSVQL